MIERPTPYPGMRFQVWNEDYSLLKYGHKLEYRAPGAMARWPSAIKLPAPVLMVTVNHAGRTESCLLVLEAIWSERIMAISPESLDAEGFSTLDEFKHYWLLRTGARPAAMQRIVVRHVRPWDSGDTEVMGAALLQHVYREAFDEALRAELAQ